MVNRSRVVVNGLEITRVHVYQRPLTFRCSVWHSYLKTQAVHFEEHFKCEKDDKEEVCDFLEIVEPRRLPVVLGRQNTGVEEHKDDDQPEHGLQKENLSLGTAHQWLLQITMKLILAKIEFGLICYRLWYKFSFSGLKMRLAGL